MALSGSYNYYPTRDTIIARALRIVGAISQGETPDATAVSEAAITLNELMKEWQADGMQMWKYTTFACSGTISAGTTITIGMSGANSANAPPLKVFNAFYRNTASGVDTPLNVITRQEYIQLSDKSEQGTPSQVYYQEPGAKSSAVTSGNTTGTLYLYPAMSADFIADNVVYVVGIYPFQDFDASTDQPDIPDYLYNALVWGLADQLAYEYGVPLSERDRITKKAQFHKAVGLSFDQEQGSIYFAPYPNWENA